MKGFSTIPISTYNIKERWKKMLKVFSEYDTRNKIPKPLEIYLYNAKDKLFI